MAIQSLDQLIAAAKQRVVMSKTATRTSIANAPFSVFDVAGQPGAGTLAGTNTANGVVPTDATTGYPILNAFGGGNLGYMTRFRANSSVSCVIDIYDRLFVAGAYSFNANVNLGSQPSYASRVPGGTDFTGLELWVEAVTAFTGNLSIAVGYTNDSGVGTRSTGTVATGIAPTVGRCIQLPLQAGDSGIQRVDSVVATVSTVGTFNVMVLRPIASLRIPIANAGDVIDYARLGMPQVFADSALYMIVTADGTSTGLPYVNFDISNG